MTYHVPVLAGASLDHLIHRPDGLYVDCTLGGGGHSSLLLTRLGPSGKVVGLDRDTQAIAEATHRLGEDARFEARHRRFGDVARETDLEGASGFLFDLGVSSHQFDEASRGFSIRANVPLDMRMDPAGTRTVADIFQEMNDDALARELSKLGEVPKSHIVGRRLRALFLERGHLLTEDLDTALLAAFPRGMRERTRELAKLSMALRMLVNEELPEIRRGLSGAWEKLAIEGRLAVITYHSVEDRLVVEVMRSLLGESHEDQRDPYGNRPLQNGVWIEKKIVPDEEELASNPRSRSARLRVIKKTRGAALGGVLLAVVVVAILGTILVGQVWRQHRFLQQARSLDSLQIQERDLRDSVELLQARITAETSPARVEVRARAYGFAPPKDQWRLPDPLASKPEAP
ncbi:MAG: mraW bacterial methyltransferase-like protein [Fibrobacterota bacterium]|jgi:16S rRNA (cytosine1402-N4)-methyltransferase